ncbi:hypothetical protein ACB098_09G023300 [Castanea mollissima]
MMNPNCALHQETLIHILQIPNMTALNLSLVRSKALKPLHCLKPHDLNLNHKKWRKQPAKVVAQCHHKSRPLEMNPDQLKMTGDQCHRRQRKTHNHSRCSLHGLPTM